MLIQGYKKEGRRVHIVSNVDPDDAAQVLLVLLMHTRARTRAHTHTLTHTALLSSLATHTQQTCSTHNRQQTHNLRLAKQFMAQMLALAGIAGPL